MAQLNQNLNLSTYRMKKMKKGIQAPGKAPLAVLPQTLRKKPSNLPSVTAQQTTPTLPQMKPMTAPLLPRNVAPPLPTAPKGMGIMGKGMSTPKLPKNG